MKKNISFLALVVGFVFCSSCGYSTRSLLPSNIRTIYISPFKNKIVYTTENNKNVYLPLLEVKLRNSVSDRFLFDGRLKVQNSETADLVLKGDLIGYERDAIRYTDNNDVLEYRIHIAVALEMWDPVQEKAVWSEPNFVGETTYFPTGSLAKSENAAVEDALTDLSRRIVERTVEDW